MRFVKFTAGDRNYDSCSFAWQPTQGYEPVVAFGGRNHDYGDLHLILVTMSEHGMIADYDPYSNQVYVLFSRKM